ncbi:large-conductance mechanosensitive channel [Mortierella sp. GBAus27b]|nr:hypothetical protein BGX31_000042 [Mortierella sp. GBA43]KAI8351988.1 large-conductance mechanosensitive channel [Mortierella sp. GBAus27b]
MMQDISSPHNYGSQGRGTRRQRFMHELHNIEESTRIPLLQGKEAIAIKARTLCGNFRDFIDNGNVLGLAVGLILGASFTGLVNSLVDDIISPPLGIALGQASLDSLFIVIKHGKHGQSKYPTLEQARDDGAVCVAYGRFVQMTFNFFMVAIALFVIIRVFQSFQQEEIIKSKVKCKYCRQKISKSATRCQFCTSWQDIAEPNHVASPAPLVDPNGNLSRN